MSFFIQALAGVVPAKDGWWLVAIYLGLQSSLPAQADAWTNRAGHVLIARLIAIEGEQVILQHTNGRTRRLPLASLRPADQQRASAQIGTEPLPSELSACFKQAEEGIQRAAQFLQGGKITREEYDVRCQTIKQRFQQLGRQVFKDRGEPPNTALLDRLNQRLDRVIDEMTVHDDRH